MVYTKTHFVIGFAEHANIVCILWTPYQNQMYTWFATLYVILRCALIVLTKKNEKALPSLRLYFHSKFCARWAHFKYYSIRATYIHFSTTKYYIWIVVYTYTHQCVTMTNATYKAKHKVYMNKIFVQNAILTFS